MSLKTASTAAWVTAGRPTRPTGLSERRDSTNGVMPKSKPQPPQLPPQYDLIVDYIVQNATDFSFFYRFFLPILFSTDLRLQIPKRSLA